MPDDAGRLDHGAPRLGPNDIDQADESIGIPRADLRPWHRLGFDGHELFGSIHLSIFPIGHGLSSFSPSPWPPVADTLAVGAFYLARGERRSSSWASQPRVVPHQDREHDHPVGDRQDEVSLGPGDNDSTSAGDIAARAARVSSGDGTRDPAPIAGHRGERQRHRDEPRQQRERRNDIAAAAVRRSRPNP
jgi:hypothetical protein